MIEKIGIELEIPLVKQDYLAADFNDVDNLLFAFLHKGWKKKIDPNTNALIAVQRETSKGKEILGPDLGVCTFEIALAPVNSLEEAIKYWRDFKSSVLLPVTRDLNLKMLGYGNQPISSNLKHLIAKKGHYSIYEKMIADDVKEWFLDNSPGLSSVQFNFEIPKNNVLLVLNTCLYLSAFIWAASANDSIANGKILTHKSRRCYSYNKIAKEKMHDRFGSPLQPFISLCEYVNRTWNVPIFEIIRKNHSFYPKNQLLTTNQFIDQVEADFFSLAEKKSTQIIQLEDLKSGIYFSWLDYRVKFNFFEEITPNELVSAVRSNDDKKLLDLVDYIVFEVRPISMQNSEEELDWLVFIYLLIENITSVNKYISMWSYQDVLHGIQAFQNKGLSQCLNGKTLGNIGIDLLNLIPKYNFSKYEKYLSRLQNRFINHRSPSDDIIHIFNEKGIEVLLDYLTLR